MLYLPRPVGSLRSPSQGCFQYPPRLLDELMRVTRYGPGVARHVIPLAPSVKGTRGDAQRGGEEGGARTFGAKDCHDVFGKERRFGRRRSLGFGRLFGRGSNGGGFCCSRSLPRMILIAIIYLLRFRGGPIWGVLVVILCQSMQEVDLKEHKCSHDREHQCVVVLIRDLVLRFVFVLSLIMMMMHSIIMASTRLKFR